MQVFFQPDLTQHSVTLSEEESKHCIRVLRMNTGDRIHLADGKGGHAIAVITDNHPKKCVLEIVEREECTPLRSYSLHMMVAPAKNFDRMEWFIEKATEAGIDEITFIETRNSERSKVNLDRCEKIAISAMKQSKQWWLPKINPVVKFDQALAGLPADSLKLMAWCETREPLLRDALDVTTRAVTLLIGPEGDFTADEVKLAATHGFKPVSLGKSILRTETAALYACMAVKTWWE